MKVTLDWMIVGVAGHGPFLRLENCSLVGNAACGSCFADPNLKFRWEDRSYREGTIWEGPWFYDDPEDVLADARWIAAHLGASLEEYGNRKARPST